MTAGAEPVLSADAVRIAFADSTDTEPRTVVDGVGFDLYPGRVLALVGESGSGKSVTAMSVLGLLPANARVGGSIRLQRQQLVGASPATLRAVRGGRIGTIFQEPMTAFDPVYTIGWQIAEALGAHRRMPRPAVRERVHELLASVGVRDVARVAAAHPHELSGGQLQRAMIAMAISCDPAVLIADEPTTALDVTVQAGILELIRRLRDERDVAVLLITHDMGVVADIADDVVVMRAGSVVERADVRTLFAAPQAEYTRTLLNAVPRLDRPAQAGSADATAAAAGEPAGRPAPAEGADRPAPAEGAGRPAPAEDAGLPPLGQRAGRSAPAEGAGRPAPGQGAGRPAPGQGAGRSASGQGAGRPAPAEDAGQSAPAVAIGSSEPTHPSLPAPAATGADEAARAEASTPEPVVTVQDVSIVYGGSGWGRRPVHAVQDASFTIAPGRTFGLVGESGSGKSTLGKALAGLVPVATGSVRVDGVDLAVASRRMLREVRSGIGYVFQDPASSLNPRGTVGRAIAEPLRLHGDMDASGRRARVAELLDAVALPASYAERYPHELSGGQRQRVAIARAVALHPVLLIADEPTSALDVSVQAQVLELFVRLQHEFGFASLFVSHDLAVVQEVAHEVAVMERGRIVEAGPARRLLTDPAEPYTRRLLAAAPVADPVAQAERREAWLRLTGGEAVA
ncbi:dipeptide ABC transporter ATP-binding protein [Microbacterium luticocti]|uniref:dipeptide ABC transporter ATP-binding protein n=1 Tax=Microbacterium luticocti TaxID=451764 RepID=UPI00040D24C3|nr:ABC transporter ATP-binding protein [Microbacterium luticocti]